MTRQHPLHNGGEAPEDWQHFLEMATTWDVLAKQRPSDKITETWALAEAIANGRKS